ncbi:MAG TPA: hypothetical protein VN515_07905 [Terriglobales bacterium]|nr:hypothetical protein [Terriglobales bacterium]
MNVQLTVQVPRSPDLNQIIDRYHQKLLPHLAAFQPELVQLQGRIVRHTSREGVICHLNLHLPTGQLSSEEAAATAQIAFRAAGEELFRQLNKHKQRLRETRPHVRVNGAAPHLRAAAPAATVAAKNRRDNLAGYFGEHYAHVLGFVRRQVQLRERLGELAPNALDPHEVLDEVVMLALESTHGSQELNRGRWLMVLAADAIRRLSKTYSGREHGQEVVALENDPIATDEADPEALAATTEMMSQVAQAMRVLPSPQRHDLVLYLIEGFRPQELAELSHRTRVEVETSLAEAEAKLRTYPQLPSSLRQRLKLSLLPQSA